MFQDTLSFSLSHVQGTVMCERYSHVGEANVWREHSHVEHAQRGQLSETVAP